MAFMLCSYWDLPLAELSYLEDFFFVSERFRFLPLVANCITSARLLRAMAFCEAFANEDAAASFTVSCYDGFFFAFLAARLAL